MDLRFYLRFYAKKKKEWLIIEVIITLLKYVNNF
jgi:hypothetical protein